VIFMRVNLKNNAVLTLIAVAAIIICLGIVLFPFIQNNIQNKKFAKEAKKWSQGQDRSYQTTVSGSKLPTWQPIAIEQKKSSLAGKTDQNAILENEPAKENPFLTKAEEEFFKNAPNTVIIIDTLHLSAIFFSSLASKAIINGRVVGIGDIVDKKEITDIKREEVLLKDTQGKYAVKLSPAR
jgi:hypothetical protein